jgi:hypothetical protein
MRLFLCLAAALGMLAVSGPASANWQDDLNDAGKGTLAVVTGFVPGFINGFAG